MRDLWAKSDGGTLAVETPIALVFDGTTQAVMMASPADLEDFVIGFALTEGLIDQPPISPVSRLSIRRRGLRRGLGCGRNSVSD